MSDALSAAVEAVARIEAANPRIFDGIVGVDDGREGYWLGEVRGFTYDGRCHLAADVAVFA